MEKRFLDICNNCVFWVPNPDSAKGKCCIDPPRAELVPVQSVGGMGMTVISFRPETGKDEFCGNGQFGAEAERHQSLIEGSGKPN